MIGVIRSRQRHQSATITTRPCFAVRQRHVSRETGSDRSAHEPSLRDRPPLAQRADRLHPRRAMRRPAQRSVSRETATGSATRDPEGAPRTRTPSLITRGCVTFHVKHHAQRARARRSDATARSLSSSSRPTECSGARTAAPTTQSSAHRSQDEHPTVVLHRVPRVGPPAQDRRRRKQRAVSRETSRGRSTSSSDGLCTRSAQRRVRCTEGPGRQLQRRA